MSLFLGNRGTKLNKLEGENMVSKVIKRGTNKENVWEHGNIGQFLKGAREQGPPLGDPQSMKFIRTSFSFITIAKAHFLAVTVRKIMN